MSALLFLSTMVLVRWRLLPRRLWTGTRHPRPFQQWACRLCLHEAPSLPAMWWHLLRGHWGEEDLW